MRRWLIATCCLLLRPTRRNNKRWPCSRENCDGQCSLPPPFSFLFLSPLSLCMVAGSGRPEWTIFRERMRSKQTRLGRSNHGYVSANSTKTLPLPSIHSPILSLSYLSLQPQIKITSDSFLTGDKSRLRAKDVINDVALFPFPLPHF